MSLKSFQQPFFIPLFAILFCSLHSICLVAQPKFNSPYSRFGLGDPLPSTLIQSTGMGGVSLGFQDALHLNSTNPASLASLDLTAYEGGFFTKGSTYSSGDKTNKALSGNLSYVALGFTTRNVINQTLEKEKPKYKIGMGVFLEPVTTIGYDITSVDTINKDQTIINQYQGDGGFYRFKYGIAIKRKNTSLGGFLGWQFGRATYENTTLFDTLPAYQNNFRDDIFMKGFVYSLGVQHSFILATATNNKDVATKTLTLGLTANANTNVNTSVDQLRIRSRGRTSNGASYIDADTLLLVDGESRKIKLPAQLGFGIMYTHINKLRLGADIVYANWDAFSNASRPEKLKSTVQFLVGGEYVPDHLSYNKYYNRIRYRFGAYYKQDPREVAGKQLNDVGISIGMGLPLVLPRQQTSALHLALELGRLGTGSVIEENYWKVSLGYTLNDNSWFFKRRFE
jgi:hypothetical protein